MLILYEYAACLLACGIDRWDVSVYGELNVHDALGGRRSHVAVVARNIITPQSADGKMDA